MTIGAEEGGKSGCIVCVLLLILGLIIPLWPITLPICWIAAFGSLRLNKSAAPRCPICKTPAEHLCPAPVETPVPPPTPK
ncbi:hypothetical protein DB347_23470 [Opitutaceae bacterium EW11]|nr:hypothetical protein DB347_23470 [Opitutaceae bacterium EW11]